MEWITFRCPGCQQGLKIGAAKAGHKVKCAQCGAVLTVPAAKRQALVGDDRPTAPVEVPAPSHDPPEEKEASAYGLAAVGSPPPVSAPKGQRPRRPDPGEKDKVIEDEPTSPKARVRRQREPVEEEELGDTEELKSRHAVDLASRWRKVSLGLLLLLVLLCLNTGGTLLMSILLQIGPITMVKAQARFATFMPILSPTLAAASLTAYGLCLVIPARNAARGLALVCMVLTVLSVGLKVLQQPISLELSKITGRMNTPNTQALSRVQAEQMRVEMEANLAEMQALQERYGRSWQWYGFVAQILGWAQTIVGLLFLRAVAEALKAQNLAVNCLTLLKFSVGIYLFIAVVQQFLPWLLSLLVRPNPQLLIYGLGPVQIILPLLILASEVWYVLVLISVRARIRVHLDEI